VPPDDNAYGEDPSTVAVAQPRAAAAGLRLRVLGAGTSVEVELPEHGEVVIGRAPTAAVRIDHPSLSRQHASLLVTTSGVHLQDLGSRNGTFVNGRRLEVGESLRLGANEIVDIGELTLVIQGQLPASQPSAPAETLRRLIERVAKSEISVLILGETGVGKEVTAERIQRLSTRADKPFVRLNCGALAETLLESELFGHARGAFTGAAAAKVGLLESADGGTVFLDEVGELSQKVQVKLLRVLESGEVLPVGAVTPRFINVRFVAATNRDLRADVAAGTFRRDLYFRLNGISITVPPLRQRRDEIPVLAKELLAGRAQLHESAVARLQRHDWPGNVRELRHVLERAMLLCDHGVIGAEQLSFDDEEPSPGASGETLERDTIVAALDAAGGNQTEAAKRLGIARGTLIAKLDVLKIPRPRKRSR
jgi:two-component system response regulator AtoC